MCVHLNVNGLNPVVLLELLTLNKLCVTDDTHYSHIKHLQYMTECRYARSLYAWNVCTNRTEFLNGDIWLYNRPNKKGERIELRMQV